MPSIAAALSSFIGPLSSEAGANRPTSNQAAELFPVGTSNPGLAQKSAPYLGIPDARGGDQTASPIGELYIQIQESISRL